MFGYLEGKIVDLTPSQTYIDIQGVGYEVQVTLNTYESIQNSKTIKLFTYNHIKEDSWIIYGFATLAEKTAFQLLISVSGVGAATARILLSSLNPDELYRIILNNDHKALQQVKGIGLKTAQRLILELKDKIPESSSMELTGFKHNTKHADALNALIGLGIGKSIAEKALQKAKKEENQSVEDWIKSALKNL